MPVTINKNKEDKGSIKKENGIESLPAVIQLNKSMVIDFSVWPINSKNIPREIAKAANTEPQPIIPTKFFVNCFPYKPIITKPINGRRGTNQTKFIIYLILFYHFNLFKILMSVDFVLRYTIIKIANPTATSAAATA